jgi:hypothetical protein
MEIQKRGERHEKLEEKTARWSYPTRKIADGVAEGANADRQAVGTAACRL